MTPSPLPALNAGLNLTACILLCIGFVLIKRQARTAHAVTMGLATLVSAAFLTSYLIYHFKVVPEVGHTPFRHVGTKKTLYLVMLFSHIVLAVVNLPMILLTLYRAFRRDWERHRRIARWTFPVWLYVSVTGVLVYLALYRWNLPA